MEIKENCLCEGIRVIYTTNQKMLREKQDPLLKRIREAEMFKRYNPGCSEEADEIIKETLKKMEVMKNECI